jgi:chemotaxis protein methyltransferase CheR
MSAVRQAEQTATWFIRLTELVESRFGLSGPAQRDRLGDYLAERTEGERPLLVDRLAGLPDSDPVWRGLIEALLVHESYFYRHPDQLDVLARQILPLLNRRQTGDAEPLRVWCAGCSTGEEAYTLAFLLRDAGCRAMVTGTDLSSEAIDQARLGRYRQRPGLHSFRAMPDHGWRHFVAHPVERDSWDIAPEIRREIVFTDHNLMAHQAPNFTADIISCRNTLIYFGPTGQRRAEATLMLAARPGTVLLLGPAERLLHTTMFQPMTDDHPQILHWPLPERC